LNHCAKKYDVVKNTLYSTEVKGATWVEKDKKWKVTISDASGNKEIMANFLITAVGQLNRP